MNARRAITVAPHGGQDVGLGRILLEASSTEGRFSLLEMRGRAGVTVPGHIHRDADELFYVLEGELIVIVDGTEIPLSAGGLAFVPRGSAHAHRTPADAPARWLTLFSPGGMEGYFAQRAALVAQHGSRSADYAGMDHEAHMDLRRRYGIELTTEGEATARHAQ